LIFAVVVGVVQLVLAALEVVEATVVVGNPGEFFVVAG